MDYLLDRYSNFWLELFTNGGLSESFAIYLKDFMLLITIALMAVASFVLIKYVIISSVHWAINRTENKFDDELEKHKVFIPLSHIAPAVIILVSVRYAMENETLTKLVEACCAIYIILSVTMVIMRALSAANDVVTVLLKRSENYKHISPKGYIQVIKIIFGSIAAILIISIMIGKSPSVILGSLAAMSAVLMLVFKDSIMGLVASIQLSMLNMLKMNDWITISNRNIEGNVIDITLNTVKVRNFDNSISTIPTYALMTESFINWSNMQEVAKSRRIKKSINIDVDSIKIADNKLLEKISQIPFMADYIKQRTSTAPDNVTYSNGAITNLELFRIYIEKYIRQNQQVLKKIKPITRKEGDMSWQEYHISDEEHEYFQKIYDNNQPESSKANGKDEQKKEHKLKLFKRKDGYWLINDVKNFRSIFKNQVVLDENNVFYYVKKRTIKEYIKGEETSKTVTEKVIEKEGMFVEDTILFIRQLPQTAVGLPLEICTYTKIVTWAEYEKVQTTFFEHIFAIIKDFELKVFQFSNSDAKLSQIV